MLRRLIPVLGTVVLLAGCDDPTTSPRDRHAPAAPRSLTSVTGDGQVYLTWLDNTESDVEGYRIFKASCPDGPDCRYTLVGATSGTTYNLAGLTNGVTRYFAVAAVDHAGNESELSYDGVFDTPRPEGLDLVLNNYRDIATGSGYDFSAYSTRRWDDASTDIFYGRTVDTGGTVHAQIFVPDFATDIQDAGYASSLDAVDWAPANGWSASGTVEAIVGHCYVVWTRDDHYAKFRVTAVGSSQVVMDWAYQVDPGNRELRARPTRGEGGAARRPIVWLP